MTYLRGHCEGWDQDSILNGFACGWLAHRQYDSTSRDEVIAQLVTALKAAKAEMRYYPGDSNLEGDAAIDRAYVLADAALKRAEEAGH